MKCDRNHCAACRGVRWGRICLHNQRRFWDSLARVCDQLYSCCQSDEGKRDLPQFDPDRLREVFTSASLFFRDYPTSDPFGFSLKILDEISKTMFSAAGVTADAYGMDQGAVTPTLSRSPMPLLTAAETRLVCLALLETQWDAATDEASIENCHKYRAECGEIRAKTDAFVKKLSRSDLLTSSAAIATEYEELKIRHHVLKLGLMQRFRLTGEEDADSHSRPRAVYVLHSGNGCSNAAIVQRSFCRAFLHGLGKFALSPSGMYPRNDCGPMGLGYLVLPQGMKGRNHANRGLSRPRPLRKGTAPQSEYVAVKVYDGTIASEVLTKEGITYGRSLLQLLDGFASTALAVLRHHDVGQGIEDTDVLFLCKVRGGVGSGGWAWLLRPAQEAILLRNPSLKSDSFRRAMTAFRFVSGGVINHCEETEKLADVVKDFTAEEQVVTAGYLVDCYALRLSPELAAEYKLIESSFPLLSEDLDGESKGAPYLYFRISEHVKQDRKDGESRPKKYLPQGSLFAVIRISRAFEKPDYQTRRAELMIDLYRLINTWRAQAAAFREIQGPLAEDAHAAAQATARVEEQRLRAASAEALAHERLQILAAFAHDAKREPEILSHVLRCEHIPRDTKSRLTATLAEGLVERSLAYSALGASTGQPEREKIIADLRAERDCCAGLDNQISISDIFVKELCLVFLRMLVSTGPFGQVRGAMFPNTAEMWTGMQRFLEHVGAGLYSKALSSLPAELAGGVSVPSARYAVPRHLTVESNGRQKEEPLLRIALSYLFGEILSNMLRHAFSPCRTVFADKRHDLKFPLCHIGLDIEQYDSALALSLSYEPGREDAIKPDPRGTGLISLGLVAGGVGLRFAQHTQLASGDRRPWFSERPDGPFVYNDWKMLGLPCEGIIDNEPAR